MHRNIQDPLSGRLLWVESPEDLETQVIVPFLLQKLGPITHHLYVSLLMVSKIIKAQRSGPVSTWGSSASSPSNYAVLSKLPGKLQEKLRENLGGIHVSYSFPVIHPFLGDVILTKKSMFDWETEHWYVSCSCSFAFTYISHTHNYQVCHGRATWTNI